MAKNRKHAVGLRKEAIIVDPTRTTLNTVTVFVDDAAALTNVDGQVSSHKYNWTRPQGPIRVISLSDGGTSPVTAAAVQISAYCYGKKTRSSYDGSDDLTVTILYDDPDTGTESDECTFTDVEYDMTSALTTKLINHRPARNRVRRSRAGANSGRGRRRQRD